MTIDLSESEIKVIASTLDMTWEISRGIQYTVDGVKTWKLERKLKNILKQNKHHYQESKI